ncbi:hypothetical protein IGW14_24475 [Streptomyces hygroscopicus subsp. hygroscopicus]|uniref:hypothetical protein n=1 Tax=Streptomyces hygroscopicus TaxID=1912 RepID=UPI001C65C8E4|nr:hypothetical protein [Streptomyces hygroscopicus]MBW8091066.1 hypothetical protein [Streptomyces hygroscopicus subsp. hygroscopicus]
MARTARETSRRPAPWAPGRARPSHPLRAFGRLGVDDRTAAVTSAMRLGLLQEAAEGGPGRSPGPLTSLP